MIISLLEVAAIALHCESGLSLEGCRRQVARQAVFWSMMRDPVARKLMAAIARGQQENAA